MKKLLPAVAVFRVLDATGKELQELSKENDNLKKELEDIMSALERISGLNRHP